METVFKVGDKVFHFQHGWGIVTGFTQSIMKVKFTKSDKFFEIDNKLLSFTEYTLQGFSQEKPIVLPEVGEVCLVKDFESDGYLVREFAEYRDGLFICRAANRQGYIEWKYMKRIKILD
jgi:hypothetical protein